MKTYTVDDINKNEPCYVSKKYFDPDKSYTLLDFLNNETCPDKDKIWVVTRFLGDKTNRLFAVWCARRALSSVDNPHFTAIHAVDIAEKYACGGATDEELYSARKNFCYATAYWDCATAYWTVCATALHSARLAAYHAAHLLNNQGNRVSERKKQIEYLKSVVKEY